MVKALHRRPLFLGAIVPLALLAGQLSTVAHSMAVEHQRCPEHGEMMHRVAVGPAPLLSDAGPERTAATAAIADHGHEHCVSLAGRREIVGPPARATAAIATPPADAVPFDRARDPGARGRLLGLAPKTSPPPLA
jgi:hypothetical protein